MYKNTFKRKLSETVLFAVSTYASVYRLITAQYVRLCICLPLQAKEKASWEIFEVHSLQFQHSDKNTRKFFAKFSPNSCQVHWYFSYYTHCRSLRFLGGNVQSLVQSMFAHDQKGRCFQTAHWWMVRVLCLAVIVSAIDFCACSAFFAWLMEALFYLNSGSFNRSLLCLEIAMSVNLMGKMRKYGVQFIGDCL